MENDKISIIDSTFEGQTEKENQDTSEEDDKLEYLDEQMASNYLFDSSLRNNLFVVVDLLFSNKQEVQGPPPEVFSL